MNQKTFSIFSRYISIGNTPWIFRRFCFIIIVMLFIYLILYKSKYSSIDIYTNKIINFKSQKMCTTKWYKQLNLEFNAFSMNNFEKVMFLMDDSYTNIIQYRFYKCIFFKFGTNIKLEPQLLEKLGGRQMSDPNRLTLCLQCKIPNEAIHPNAMTIDFMLRNDYTNGVNITICRSYESSFNFLNSRIYLENITTNELKFENKSSFLIGACTQTSLYDFNFPLWINYHYKMGINHFYIYDHARSNVTRLHTSLKSYIDYNIVTIVPWYIDQWNGFEHHSSSVDWISHQIWSQNDCIHRYGHLYSWILISDVDEFVVPMGKFTNFKEILNEIPLNYCALQVLNYNFRSLSNETFVEEKDRPKKNIFRELKPSERNENSKNFVRPHLIYYFAVHQVTLSVNNAPVYYADVNTDARLQHYRARKAELHELSNFIVDTRILSFLNSINESILSIISN